MYICPMARNTYILLDRKYFRKFWEAKFKISPVTCTTEQKNSFAKKYRDKLNVEKDFFKFSNPNSREVQKRINWSWQLLNCLLWFQLKKCPINILVQYHWTIGLYTLYTAGSQNIIQNGACFS